EVPAVGVAFGLEPIMDTLRLEKKIKNKSVAQVYVIPINTVAESLKIVQELRENGVAASFSLGKKGVSKNLEYASSLGIPYAIIIGEDELKQKKVLLRDMNDGTQQLLIVKEVIKKLHG
ncbi:MAG TPA: His/Gly/Thr/Pro-type tRNA ligase C-terminal domain-containing protein, partial [Candidatus Nanoarchaeia archaeon]|nr:His/Gly/Thr/Pro-type tRNA ligase C-terminal domain-containing protein [Candidatus Nanoarchaeia archaeon]